MRRQHGVFAVQSDREPMIREVLSRRVDLGARGSLWLTALGLSVIRDNTYAFRRLLPLGAHPDGADANRTTSLASAIRLGRTKMG